MKMAHYCRKKSKRAEKSIPAPSLNSEQESNTSQNTMASPETDQHQQPTTQNPNMSKVEEEDQSLQPQSVASETLTLETQNPQIPDQNPQQMEDLEEADQEETEQSGVLSSTTVPPSQPITDTHVTINVPDQDPVLENPPLMTPRTARSVARRVAAKRKKPMAAKKRQAVKKKLEILVKTFKPIPFLPNKTLDFLTHEKLLKRLGLWDFVHLEFDRSIRTDLLVQLVASFNPQNRCSYINDNRITLSRADLARALKLPGKKDKMNVVEVEGDAEMVSEESIAFVEDLVSNWVLLHEDTWILPNEVLNWTRPIKEGHPEKVDWASLMWFMVEKEVSQGSRLGHCYYASHLQCLIKLQREVLFSEQPIVVVDITVKEDEEEDAGEGKVSEDSGDVKVSEDGDQLKISEECSDVKMGEDRCDVKMGEDCSDVKMVEDGDNTKTVEDMIDVKMVEDHSDMKMTEDGDCVKTVEDRIDLKMAEDGTDVKMDEYDSGVNMGNGGSNGLRELEEPNIELSLGQDSFEKEQLVQGVAMDFDECKEQEPGQSLLNGKNDVGEHFLQRCNQDRVLVCDEEENQEEQEDQVHEQEQQEGGFTFLPNCNSIEAISSANLIQEIEASQVPYSSPMQHRDHSLAAQFTSRVEVNPFSSGPSFSGNVSKREIDYEHDLSQQSLNGNPKRLRSDDPWEQKSSDFDLCLENVQHWIGKAKMLYQAKEHTCTDLSVNQELLMNELQQRGNMIEQLQKARFEEQQKRQVDIYRLERELFGMGDLLKGYRKALKETSRAFSEYRALCPLPDEPLYKDVAGSGGLVLSVAELERQRLKQEEEEKIKRIEIEGKVEEIEAIWTDVFEVHLNKAQILESKLLDVEKEVELLKEISLECKGSLTADSPINE